MPHWLNTGDTAWQMTAATFVGLMSVPGLVVLYGGVMQKRWSINSMMLSFVSFAVVIVVWALWAFKMGFGHPLFHTGSKSGFFQGFVGTPGASLSAKDLTQQGVVYGAYGTPVTMAFPEGALFYFQLVFAAISPLLALGSEIGRAHV